MRTINRLGIKVFLITTVVVLVLFAIGWGVRALIVSHRHSPEVVPASASDQTQNPITLDSDGDGLPDAVEEAYKADPRNADTDGDGTKDGDEVFLQRDPAKAGPNDALPKSEQVGSESIIPTDTYTGRYLAQLPSDASQDQVLDKNRLQQFVDEARLPLLPNLPQGTIQTTTASGKDAIQTYLDAISPGQNAQIATVSNTDIEDAFKTQYTDKASQTLDEIVAKLENNVAILKRVPVPPEAVDLHTKLLQASQSLVDNTKLLKDMPNDFVGGLVGAKNIDELGPVFADIESQIRSLETKYEIE